jgi:hypothetical protein
VKVDSRVAPTWFFHVGAFFLKPAWVPAIEVGGHSAAAKLRPRKYALEPPLPLCLSNLDHISEHY